MSGGPGVEYRWPMPTAKGKKETPQSLPAPDYVDHLAGWVYSELSDTTVFVKDGESFPKSFIPSCKKILSRLFRVFSHIYNHHWKDVMKVGADPHVNTGFKHFYFFVTEFHLVDEKSMDGLSRVIETVKASP